MFDVAKGEVKKFKDRKIQKVDFSSSADEFAKAVGAAQNKWIVADMIITSDGYEKDS